MAPLLNKHIWDESALSREKNTLKCCQTDFQAKSITPIPGLSNEILCILVEQKTKTDKCQSWRS